MKKFPMFLFLALAIGFASCSKDDDEDNNDDPGYNFEEQTLQGSIDGNDWTLRNGVVRHDMNDSTGADFDFWSEEQDTTDMCDNFFFPTGDNIMFSLPLEEGLYTLGTGENQYTVTLFGAENNVNSIATSGAVEITSVTTTDSIMTVSGRMDARADDDNHVNGEFETIMVCH